MYQPALLIIDVQKGFDDPSWGRRNNPQAEENMSRILDAWREKGDPVIHVKHNSIEPDSPLRPELPGNAFREEVKPLPAEKQFEKNVNSAFIGTGLEAYLHEKGITSLVIVGLTTDHCVSTSVRMAANLGFSVTLISDATATFDKTGSDGVMYAAEEIHKYNLVSLEGEFCEVQSTEKILQQMHKS